ncbi:unnamed protein product [Camellia sinensis]
MAMMAVKVVIEKLGSLLAAEAQFLGGVGRAVTELRDDLESKRSFLQDAEARSESDKGVQTWVKQVRDESFDTEDILEEFLLRLAQPKGNGFFHSLRKGYQHLRQLRARHRLAIQVEDVKRKVKMMLIGQNLTAISVVGMGGVGKTTLVKKVYDSQAVKTYFKHHAWE